MKIGRHLSTFRNILLAPCPGSEQDCGASASLCELTWLYVVEDRVFVKLDSTCNVTLSPSPNHCCRGNATVHFMFFPR